ncbi:MAG: hypothetical protein PHD70_14635 [Anaerostipes sp.]|nr:hypothetical protein [Anaerostipes sp.]
MKKKRFIIIFFVIIPFCFFVIQSLTAILRPKVGENEKKKMKIGFEQAIKNDKIPSNYSVYVEPNDACRYRIVKDGEKLIIDYEDAKTERVWKKGVMTTFTQKSEAYDPIKKVESCSLEKFQTRFHIDIPSINKEWQKLYLTKNNLSRGYEIDLNKTEKEYQLSAGVEEGVELTFLIQAYTDKKCKTYDRICVIYEDLKKKYYMYFADELKKDELPKDDDINDIPYLYMYEELDSK